MSEKLTPLQQELLDRADSIMASMATAVEKASTFASEQVPDIALQYVAFGRSILTIYVILGIALFCLGVYGFVKKLPNAKSEDAEMGWFMFSTVTLVSGFVVTGINLTKFVMVWVAPKIWLINEIVNLVKR